jgi:uncharacterized protein (DUF736 family)
MAIIGKFKQPRLEHFVGRIQTLTLDLDVEILPVNLAAGDNRPNYRVVNKPAGIDIGAAWSRQSDTGNSYLSVQLDDPSFAEPLRANLVARDESAFELIWTRRKSGV